MRWIVTLLMLSSCDVVFADIRSGISLDALRCGTDLVRVGEYSYQLTDACGEPDHREVVSLLREGVEVRGPDGEFGINYSMGELQPVERWVYHPGRGRMTRIVTVIGGILTDIRVDERSN